MATSPPARHMVNLGYNMAEVKRLLQIHKELTGSSVGYRHDMEVLSKSAIVLLVACREAFVEDLASNAFDALMNAANTHSVFPKAVLVLASRDLKQATDAREVWKLAGEGWKQVLRDHKQAVLGQHVGKLNTPKPKQIDALFNALLGISAISSRWHWKGMAAQHACKKLEDLVELRGSIAHRVATPRGVYKKDPASHIGFVYRLAVVSSNQVLTYVNAQTHTVPWARYTFRNTS